MSAFKIIIGCDLNGFDVPLFVSTRSRPQVTLKLREGEVVFLRARQVGAIHIIQGSAPFALCMSHPEELSLELRSTPHPQEAGRHVLHFPTGFPVGALKRQKQYICTTTRDKGELCDVFFRESRRVRRRRF